MERRKRDGSDSRVAASNLPPWMNADEISKLEKMEIMAYKCITYIPVAVTFGVFIFLFVFYAYVSNFISSCLNRKIYSTTCIPRFSAIFSLPSRFQTCGKTRLKCKATEGKLLFDCHSSCSAASTCLQQSC